MKIEDTDGSMLIEKTPEADGFVTRWGDSITNYTLEEGLQLLDWLYSHHEWLRGKDDLQPVPPFQARDEIATWKEVIAEERLQALADHIVQGSDAAEAEAALRDAPARADGHISYADAQRLKLCCYCGNKGVLYSGPERDDEDFQAYQCMNCERIFYISKEAE